MRLPLPVKLAPGHEPQIKGAGGLPVRRPHVSFLLMLLFSISFVAQQVLIVPKSYHAYLFLSGYGMKSGQLWELFTCQFFHSNHSLVLGITHLLVNLAGLWFLGRTVETHWGSGRFLLLYFGAGLAGALAQGAFAVAGFLLPESQATAADFLIARFGESVGSSIGLCGVFAVFCQWRRDTTFRLLWLLPLRGRYLLWLAFGCSALLLLVPSDPSLAHMGHFVGLLTGLVFFRLWREPNARRKA